MMKREPTNHILALRIADLHVLFKGRAELDEIMPSSSTCSASSSSRSRAPHHSLSPLTTEFMLKFTNNTNNKASFSSTQDIRIGIVSRGRVYADRLNAIAFSNLTAAGSASLVSSNVRVVALVLECLLELIELEYCLFEGPRRPTPSSCVRRPSVVAGRRASSSSSWTTRSCASKRSSRIRSRTSPSTKPPPPRPLLHHRRTNCPHRPRRRRTWTGRCSRRGKPVQGEAGLWQAAFIECYAPFRDYKIVNAASAAELAGDKKTKRQKVCDDAGRGGVGGGKDQDDHDALIKIICKRHMSIKIFALTFEIIDSLLEDWYPDLGTRFMQDSKASCVSLSKSI